MKKAILFLLLTVFVVLAAGCATTAPTKTQCPSCGYEFDVPQTR